MRRPASLAALLVAAVTGHAHPALAEPEDPLPDFGLDSAIACLANTMVEVERTGVDGDPAGIAEEMGFLSRLIVVKSTPEDHAAYYARLTEALA